MCQLLTMKYILLQNKIQGKLLCGSYVNGLYPKSVSYQSVSLYLALILGSRERKWGCRKTLTWEQEVARLWLKNFSAWESSTYMSGRGRLGGRLRIRPRSSVKLPKLGGTADRVQGK